MRVYRFKLASHDFIDPDILTATAAESGVSLSLDESRTEMAQDSKPGQTPWRPHLTHAVTVTVRGSVDQAIMFHEMTRHRFNLTRFSNTDITDENQKPVDLDF